MVDDEHARSQLLSLNNSGNGIYIVRLAMEKRISASKSIIQEMRMFVACAVFARMMHRRLQQRGL